jgi:hypothetical protein
MKWSMIGDLYFIMILLSIYIYNWMGNKFLQLTSPSPYKYINSINKTNQMTANVQAISIIISKLSKINYKVSKLFAIASGEANVYRSSYY